MRSLLNLARLCPGCRLRPSDDVCVGSFVNLRMALDGNAPTFVALDRFGAHSLSHHVCGLERHPRHGAFCDKVIVQRLRAIGMAEAIEQIAKALCAGSLEMRREARRALSRRWTLQDP